MEALALTDALATYVRAECGARETAEDVTEAPTSSGEAGRGDMTDADPGERSRANDVLIRLHEQLFRLRRDATSRHLWRAAHATTVRLVALRIRRVHCRQR